MPTAIRQELGAVESNDLHRSLVKVGVAKVPLEAKTLHHSCALALCKRFEPKVEHNRLEQFGRVDCHSEEWLPRFAILLGSIPTSGTFSTAYKAPAPA